MAKGKRTQRRELRGVSDHAREASGIEAPTRADLARIDRKRSRPSPMTPSTVLEEIVAAKGYHSRTTAHDLETLEIRTYISEPDRGPQSWIDQELERDAVYANRRRIRGDRRKRLLRKRGELLERPCAHLYETGGLRRAHVRSRERAEADGRNAR